VLVASWAGFAIAQLPPRAARLVIGASFVALMVPVTALLVPRFALFRTLEFTNTYVPLVAPALLGMSPFYVLLYWWAFRRLPGDVLDAARVDGSGRSRSGPASRCRSCGRSRSPSRRSRSSSAGRTSSIR